MIDEADLAALQARLQWATFAVAFVLGIAMSRTNFCTMGAVSDIVTMGDWRRMRMWVGAAGVAMLGTQALQWSGYIDTGKSLYAAPRLLWASSIVGGIAFGFGMVLASGCASKTLIRIGGGSLKSLTVAIVLGLSAYTTLKGILAVARVGTVDRLAVVLPDSPIAPRWLGARLGIEAAALPGFQFAFACALALAMLLFAFGPRDGRSRNGLAGALLVGGAIVAVWAISGHWGYLPEHPRTLEEAFVATSSGRIESLSFVAPIAYTLELLMFWSDASRSASIGVVAALGMVAGALVDAVASRAFRYEGFAGTEDTANHLVGAVLMGAGGVTALGCTVGQGLSGVSTLAFGSFVALAAILLGAWAGLQYQQWRVLSSD